MRYGYLKTVKKNSRPIQGRELIYSRGTTLIPANDRPSFGYDLTYRFIPAPRITVGEAGFLTCGLPRFQVTAPEGFSTRQPAPAHTLPGSLSVSFECTRLHYHR